MKAFRAYAFVIALSALSPLCIAQEQTHVIVPGGNVQWGPASAKLPPGAQFAILHGDPSKPGEPYVFRAKLPDGYSVPPHTHPMDGNVTVLSGVFMLGFGDRLDKATTKALTTGSYVMLPKEMPHYNVTRGETILQFHGIGPYDIRYVNPGDDPSRATAARP
jgi:hypothetical protein